MDDSLGRQIHELLRQAFELEGPRRRELIDSACAADQRLEKRRFRLLAAIDDSQSFLDRPVLASSHPAVQSLPVEVPDRVGNYQIVRLLGSGGMGAVYEALQDQPRRKVALKIPHRRQPPGSDANSRKSPGSDADSRSLRSELGSDPLPESVQSPASVPLPGRLPNGRWDAGLPLQHESEVLARLQHPAIAQVYEAGQHMSPNGDMFPFFAMEFVPDARRLTEYAREKSLGIRERLELFRTVCLAIHHGHRLGVIHRDLKPANILVNPDGQPKVIDFGVARSSLPTDSGDQPPNAAGQVVGTLNYISPEQFGESRAVVPNCSSASPGPHLALPSFVPSAEPFPVDARTDVYSLGVVLFELLCGDLPHQLSGLPLGEAVRKLRHDSPRRPRVFQPRLPNDLEAIVLKAIARDPEQRYASADAFGSDVQRFLDGLPVEAWPPTAGYQLKKFVRRNRILSSTLAASAALLLLGIMVTSRLAWVANQARTAAEQRESELETITEFQESLLREIDIAKMGDRLSANLTDSVVATAASPDMARAAREELDRIFERVNFTSLAIQFLRENVLQRYAGSIDEKFAGQPVIKARLLQRLAGTFDTLGLHADAEQALREALRLRRSSLGEDHADTLHTMLSLGSVLSTLEKSEEAVALLTDAHRRYRAALGPDHEDTLRTGNSLGGALRRQGNLAEAERVWGETLAVQRRVRGDDNADTLGTLNNMGVVYAYQGRMAEAERAWRELLERRRRVLGPDHPDYLGSLSNLGALLQDQGKLEEARPLLEESLAAERRHNGDLHSDTLITMTQLASLLHERGVAESRAVVPNCSSSRPGSDAISRSPRSELGSDPLPGSAQSPGSDAISRSPRSELGSDPLSESAQSPGSDAISRSPRSELGSDPLPETAQSPGSDAISRSPRSELGSGPLPGSAESFFAAAESLQRECVAGRRKTFGPTDPATLRAEAFLAAIQHSSGDSAAAETLLNTVLAAQRHQLGDDHPDTIQTLHFLSRLLANHSRYAEALPLSTEALAHARATDLTGPLSLGEVLASHGELLLMSHIQGTDVDQQGSDTVSGSPRSEEGSDPLRGSPQSSAPAPTPQPESDTTPEPLTTARSLLLEAHTLLSSTLGPTHPKTRQAATHLAHCYEELHRLHPTAGHEQSAIAWHAKADQQP